jgi:hypothetical protein
VDRVRHLGHRVAEGARGGVDRIRHPAPAFLVALGALLVPATLAVLATSLIDGSKHSGPIEASPPGTAPTAPTERPIEEPERGTVAHVNSAGDYAFAYPSAWQIEEAEAVTRLESPNGDIVLSFEPGASGDIATASGRLVSSILGVDGSDPLAGQALTGSAWERIDGSRSFIVSGVTEDPTGRSMRFLAITVRAVPRTYAISGLVPAGSDPTRVLPTIEEIVSSFEVLDAGAAVAA